MPTKTKDQPKDESMEDTYNLLMWEIEPDLTTVMLPHLDEIYEGETKKEQKNRLTWYAQAFEIFQERFALFMDVWKEGLKEVRALRLGVDPFGRRSRTGRERAEDCPRVGR